MRDEGGHESDPLIIGQESPWNLKLVILFLARILAIHAYLKTTVTTAPAITAFLTVNPLSLSSIKRKSKREKMRGERKTKFGLFSFSLFRNRENFLLSIQRFHLSFSRISWISRSVSELIKLGHSHSLSHTNTPSFNITTIAQEKPLILYTSTGPQLHPTSYCVCLPFCEPSFHD